MTKEDELWGNENYPELVTYYSSKLSSFSDSDKKKKKKEYSYWVYQRGAVYLTMEPKNYSLAKQDVAFALQLDPDCPNANASMADILNNEDTTASYRSAIEHATRALNSKHKGGEWKKGDLRFKATMARANARFELLDDKKLGYSDELSEQAEEDFKVLLDTKWKDYKPDDDTLQDLRDKLEDIKKEAKRMAKTAKDKSAGHGLGLGKRHRGEEDIKKEAKRMAKTVKDKSAEEKPSAKAGKMAKGGGEAPAVPERPVR
jgi:hypothetical protein